MVYKYLIMGIAFLGLLSYSLYLRVDNESLGNANKNLEKELERARGEILLAKTSLTKSQQQAKDLSKTVNDERLKIQDLQSRLSKLERVSDKAFSKHPKLIENAVNNATEKVNNCFEILSKGGECD
jgi:predicted  nucleic acid-binding Zn-ribbon protein